MTHSSLDRITDLTVDALAVKRLTRLVVEDTITESLRNLIWNKFGGPESGKGIGYLVSCPHCTSIYVAAGVTVLRKVAPKVWSPIADGLALASVTSMIAERG